MSLLYSCQAGYASPTTMPKIAKSNGGPADQDSTSGPAVWGLRFRYGVVKYQLQQQFING